MSDRIDFGGEPWKAIPRRILRDKRLSPAAKGGLVTLLSHEDGWVRSVTSILMKENRRCGRSQAQSILRELVDVGYAEHEQSRRKDGTFGSAYVIHASSEPATSSSPVAVERVAVEPPTVVPVTVDPSPIEQEPLEVEIQGQEPITAAAAKSKNRELAEVLLSPDSRSRYFLERLRQRGGQWAKVTDGAVMKLGKTYGTAIVISALGECHEDGSTPFAAFPYLESICVRKQAEAAA